MVVATDANGEGTDVGLRGADDSAGTRSCRLKEWEPAWLFSTAEELGLPSEHHLSLTSCSIFKKQSDQQIRVLNFCRLIAAISSRE